MNLEDLYKIKLQGLDIHESTIPTLTPRTTEVLLKHGVDPQDLYFKSLELFKDETNDADIRKLRFDFHEAQRNLLYNELSDLRNKLIKLPNIDIDPANKIKSLALLSKQDLEKFGVKVQFDSNYYKPLVKYDKKNANETNLTREETRLRNLQRRQRKEIEQMINQEMRLKTLREEAEGRKEEEEKRMNRLQCRRIKRLENVKLLRRKKELEKAAKEREEFIIKEALEKAHFKRNSEIARKERVKQERQKIIAKEREEQRKARQKELKAKTERIMKEKLRIANEKVCARENKALEREKIRKEKIKTMKVEAARKKERQRLRMESNRKKLLEFEKNKLDSMVFKKQRAEEKRVIAQKEEFRRQKEEEEKRNLLSFKREVKLRQVQGEREARSAFIMSNRLSREKEMLKKSILKEKQLKLKKEKLALMKMEKLSRIKRQQRQGEYKRLLLQSKINAYEVKVRAKKEEKQKLWKERKLATQRANSRRNKIHQELEKMKQTNCWKNGSHLLKLLEE